MADIDYPSNSYKSKEIKNREETSQKKIEKIVTNPVKTKKNGTKAFLDIFVPGDVENVKSYIFMDVLVPTIKKAVYDIIANGMDMILYGGEGSHKNKSSSSSVSYRSYYDSPSDRFSSKTTSTRSSGFRYNDITLRTRGEAEAVLEKMEEIIGRYQIVSVADLCEMLDISSDYTDNKYGWTNLRNADVIHTRDGYLLKLPKAMPIN